MEALETVDNEGLVALRTDFVRAERNIVKDMKVSGRVLNCSVTTGTPPALRVRPPAELT